MPHRLITAALLLLGACGCARHAPAGASTAAAAAGATGSAPTLSDAPRCLADGSGYLRLRGGGALDLDIDWKDPALECEGSPRPDQHGLRLSFAGGEPGGKHRPRLVLGLEAAPGGGTLHAVPANVTLILEGEDRLFSTRGDNRCTVDELVQTPISDGAPGSGTRAWRVTGRGFCTSPAASLDGREHLLISRFDFAGRAIDAEPGDHSK